jgi:hypothetical protein
MLYPFELRAHRDSTHCTESVYRNGLVRRGVALQEAGFFHSTAMNFRHTGEGTWSVRFVSVNRPLLASIRNTAMLFVS